MNHLYTWVDVQQAFEDAVAAWPTELLAARAYWDGLVIEHLDGGAEACVSWLRDTFGSRFVEHGAHIHLRLESLPNQPERFLAVTFEVAAGDDPPAIRRKTFRMPEVATRRRPPPLAEAPLPARVYAWHSFKGGVGRTTTAVQFSRLLARCPGVTVMLVDMDFEAPGITWMTEASRMPHPTLSVADILALVHSSPPDVMDDVTTLIVARLRGAMVDGLVILPALRPTQREADVLPEHLERSGTADLVALFADIGHRLGATHVVCDLRAGRSELAASLLLDRRVSRVLVTTCAGQSLKGTARMIRDLAATLPRDESEAPLSLFISKVESAEQFADAKGELVAEAEELLASASADAVFPIRFSAIPHASALHSLPLDWNDVVTGLDLHLDHDGGGWDVDMTLLQWVAAEAPNGGPVMSAATTAPRTPPTAGMTWDDRRRKLQEFTAPLIVAEGMGGGPLLPAQFLVRLAQAHRYELPVNVMVGEKGAGKTFTFLQLVRHGSWPAFTRAFDQEATVPGRVVPVLWPGALQGEAKTAIDNALRETGGCDARLASVRALLTSAMATPTTDWRGWWLGLFASALGLEGPDGLATATLDRAEAPLFVIDGLEELLPDLHTDDAAQRCLRALLQEVPTWLRGLRSGMGVLMFVRSDFVSAAIPQNTEQFLAQHRAYELWWDHHAARELVTWAVQKSCAIDDAAPNELLTKVWGRQTGRGVSPVAPVDAWVMDAMSTRKRKASALTARDVVRFLHEAATRSLGHGDEPPLLVWDAVRGALETVGVEKVKELREMVPTLGDALDHIAALQGYTVPFRYHKLPNDASRLALLELENQEIAFRVRGEVWLLPLYWRGLGLRLAPRRRERVLPP